MEINIGFGVRNKIENVNEIIKTVLLLLIATVDNTILYEYVNVCLSDGITTFKYNKLIELSRKALDEWEKKINKSNILNKKEAMEYLGFTNPRQLKHLKEQYNIKVTKNQKGENLYHLTELNRAKSLTRFSSK